MVRPFLGSVLIEIILTVFLAGVGVISIFPFSFFALVIWFSLAVEFFRIRKEALNWKWSLLGICTSTFIFSALVYGAANYPHSKTTERWLESSMDVRATEMSLADLKYYVQFVMGRHPISSLSFAEEDKDLVVRFPSKQLTVREFINCVESQTVLRYRFGHCGNGWTMWSGGDCSFGLALRDPVLAGPPPRPKKAYDGDSYIPPWANETRTSDPN